MKIEVEILKSEFASKISHIHNKLDSIEFKNANLLQKMQVSTLRWEKWEQKLTKVTKKQLEVFH
jgi:hypothetical protein